MYKCTNDNIIIYSGMCLGSLFVLGWKLSMGTLITVLFYVLENNPLRNSCQTPYLTA